MISARCPSSLCDVNFGNKSGRSIGDQDLDLAQQPPPDDGALMASYSVFVVEPGAVLGKKSIT